MRKLVVFNNVTLDGYFTSVDGDFSWAHSGNETKERSRMAIQHFFSQDSRFGMLNAISWDTGYFHAMLLR